MNVDAVAVINEAAAALPMRLQLWLSMRLLFQM